MCIQDNNHEQYFKRFIKVLFYTVIAFIVVIVWSNAQFRKSRKELAEALDTHIVHTKGLLEASQGMYANHQECVTEGLYDILDSLSRQPVKNQKMITSALKSCLVEIKNLEGVVDNSEMRHEFDMMKNDIEVTLEYLNSHVQLHIDKMNNTVSTLELWAAVLTIIFLVFSFYSLYKVDELVKQGREGVNDINKLKDKGDKVVVAFNSESKTALKGMNDQIKEAIKEHSDIALKQYELTEAVLKERINEAIKISEQAIKEFSQYKSMIDAEKNYLSTKTHEFNEKSNAVIKQLERLSEASHGH